MDLKEKIRSIENFPEEGVIFRDITTLLKGTPCGKPLTRFRQIWTAWILT